MARHPKVHARHAAAARLRKRELLPLPKEAVDEMSLQYHAALAALSARHGSAYGLDLLQQLITIARFIGEASATKMDLVALKQLAAALQIAHERGEETGEWYVDAPAQSLCAALVNEHERQLRVTPIGALQNALERAKRFARMQRDGGRHPGPE